MKAKIKNKVAIVPVGATTAVVNVTETKKFPVTGDAAQNWKAQNTKQQALCVVKKGGTTNR